MKLQKHQETTVTAIKPKHSVFTNANDIAWSEWVMEGTYFKLLNLNLQTGGFTMLLKVDPHTDPVPVHGHVGAVEVYITEGEFGYDDDRGAKGWYGYEPAGARHEPNSPRGTTMFAVAYGPIVGYNPDGSIAAVVDAHSMYELAKSNNAHTHIMRIFPEAGKRALVDRKICGSKC